MARRKLRRAARSSSQELQARKSCEAPCRTYSDKMSDAFDKDKPQKVLDFHAKRYWRCVADCMEGRLPRKSLTKRRIAKSRTKRK